MEATKQGMRGGRAASWTGIVWRARAGLVIFALAAAALVVVPQTQDMLADLADFDDFTWETVGHAAGFHLAMILMAFGLWYWARAVLLAWFELPDSLEARAAFADGIGAVGTTSQVQARKLAMPAEGAPQPAAGAGGTDATWTVRAFDFVPRGLGLGTAAIAAVASWRSDNWLETIVALAWGLGFYHLLKYRLVLQKKLGWHQTAGSDSDRRGGGWLGDRAWRSLSELLDYAPLGRWFAIASLAAGSALFVLSALTAFLDRAILAKIALAYWLPGPAIALLLLAMLVAPLSAITYAMDRAARREEIDGVAVKLHRIPVLTLLLVLMGTAAVIMNLHAIRVIDDAGAMAPAGRASLGALFQAWAARCAPGGGPVQPIIVAVSGGASRAGMWAARVLDVVDDSVQQSHSRSAAIFAVSSVSGGSLGAAAYVAMRSAESAHRAPNAPCALTPLSTIGDPSPQKIRQTAEIEALRADAIGPAVTGMILGDGPRALAAYIAVPAIYVYDAIRNWWNGTDARTVLRGNDRAEALERAFEHNWRTRVIDTLRDDAIDAEPVGFDRPYLSLFYAGKTAASVRGDVPLWITNGTDADTGDRLITVPFKVNQESFCAGAKLKGKRVLGGPNDGHWVGATVPPGCGPADAFFWYATGPFTAARDVLSLLKADVPISTAIDNTSRFPFLSPSGELTPVSDAQPRRKKPDDAQIIDGGYFENEGVMSAMEVARWLRTYGPGLIGRPVYPIVVQATADADSGKTERNIARCGNGLPLNPGVADAAGRSSQFLVPLNGLTAVRGGHSRALLQQALEDFCDEGGQQAFFHFYLYNSPEADVPLNWSLSEDIADYIWNDAIDACGNAAERKNLTSTLRLPLTAWQPAASRAGRGSRDIFTCTQAPVKVTIQDLPRLSTTSD